MRLLTKEIRDKLLRNSNQQGERLIETDESIDFKPVVKMFTPWGSATWLFTELDEDGRLFGLCDLGFGTPELGYASLQEIEELVGPFGLKIERDQYFEADKTLSEYAAAARESGRIAA